MHSAKLLLFGEYTLLHGSMALSAPFSRLKGEFDFATPCTNEAEISNVQLKGFLSYIEEVHDALPYDIDCDRFKQDLHQGLYFKSNIPEGYGVGSSGALVAEVYERYALAPLKPRCGNIELSLLRNQLSVLENYFHGTSSGNDPLVCYSGWTILTREDKTITRLRGDRLHLPMVKLFLADTKAFGNTKENVDKFKSLMKQQDFREGFCTKVIPAVNCCTMSYIGVRAELIPQLYNLSQLHLEYFKDMIPEHFIEHFIHGIQYEKFALKLCGSGGGGYMLGFTQNIEQAKEYFSMFDIPIIEV
jgi:mevalonate kinase